MKKTVCLTAVFLLLFFSNVFAKIVEAEHFHELAQYVTSDTLVLLDIDDTLLIPAQSLGTDVWFRERLKYHENKEINPSKALDHALSEWEAVRQLTKVILVEEGTEKIVQDLQQKPVKVMGLTTQGLALATCTINQLESLKIDLSLTAPSAEDDYFINGKTGVLYRQGILFTSGTDKGAALFKYLDHIGYCPKHIVFINDKASHLEDVEKSVVARGIKFDGLRYAFSDKRVEGYDPLISKLQWEQSSFGEILSDEKAKELLKSVKIK